MSSAYESRGHDAGAPLAREPHDGKVRLVEAVLEALSPTRCACCERPGALVCDACAAALPVIDARDACVCCGAPFGVLLCTECGGIPLTSGRCLAATTFAGPPARIVRAYKDAGEHRLAPWIAQVMAQAALTAQVRAPDRFGGLLDEADAVVFVPATAQAYLRRGFDHMEAIARAFCDTCGLSLVDALLKHGAADQRALGRLARAQRARDAYEVVAPVRAARVLLLDDVITTGATISAAARALTRAGASRVDVLAFARVW